MRLRPGSVHRGRAPGHNAGRRSGTRREGRWSDTVRFSAHVAAWPAGGGSARTGHRSQEPPADRIGGYRLRPDRWGRRRAASAERSGSRDMGPISAGGTDGCPIKFDLLTASQHHVNLEGAPTLTPTTAEASSQSGKCPALERAGWPRPLRARRCDAVGSVAARGLRQRSWCAAVSSAWSRPACGRAARTAGLRAVVVDAGVQVQAPAWPPGCFAPQSGSEETGRTR